MLQNLTPALVNPGFQHVPDHPLFAAIWLSYRRAALSSATCRRLLPILRKGEGEGEGQRWGKCYVIKIQETPPWTLPGLARFNCRVICSGSSLKSPGASCSLRNACDALGLLV